MLFIPCIGCAKVKECLAVSKRLHRFLRFHGKARLFTRNDCLAMALEQILRAQHPKIITITIVKKGWITKMFFGRLLEGQ
jgi:hypothetical protein